MFGVTLERALQCWVGLSRPIQRVQECSEIILRKGDGFMRLHNRLSLFDRVPEHEFGYKPAE